MGIWDRPPAPLQNCPTPTKRRYPTKRGAEIAATRLGDKLACYGSPYLCKCRWWHLTSKGTS